MFHRKARDIDNLSIDELESSFLVHEQRINHRASIEEKVLKASTSIPAAFEGAGRGHGRGRGRGKFNSFSRGKGRGKTSKFDKSHIECFNCHKYGHYRLKCPTFTLGQGEQSNYAMINEENVEEEEETTLLITCHNKREKYDNMWYIDSGYSNHMCGNKLLFSEFDESFRDTVKIRDNSSVVVMGKGIVNVYLKKDVFKRISNVFCVIDLKSNLIRLSKL